jgi:hypothetical protein
LPAAELVAPVGGEEERELGYNQGEGEYFEEEIEEGLEAEEVG